jgi:hypothetical protein
MKPCFWLYLVGATLSLSQVVAERTVRSCAVRTVAPDSSWTSITIEPPTDSLRSEGTDALVHVTYKDSLVIAGIRLKWEQNVLLLPESIQLLKNRRLNTLLQQTQACVMAAYPGGVAIVEPVVCPLRGSEVRPVTITSPVPYFKSTWRHPPHPESLYYHQVIIDDLIRIEEIAVLPNGRIIMPVEFYPQQKRFSAIELSRDFEVTLKSTLNVAPTKFAISGHPLQIEKVIYYPPKEIRGGPLVGFFEVWLNNGIKLSDIVLYNFAGVAQTFFYPSNIADLSTGMRNKKVRPLYEVSVALRAIIEPAMLDALHRYQESSNGKPSFIGYPVPSTAIAVGWVELTPGSGDVLASATFTLNDLLKIHAARLMRDGTLHYPTRIRTSGQIAPAMYVSPRQHITLNQRIYTAFYEKQRQTREPR